MVFVEVLSFDVGGTLLDTSKMFSLLIDELAKALGVNLDERRSVEKAFLRVYERCRLRRRLGEVDGFNIVVESQKLLAHELGITHDVVLEVIEKAFSIANPQHLVYTDVISTLVLLHKHGFRMGIVGNTVFWSSRCTKEVLEKLGIAKLFEIMLFSDTTRINKPDRGIFLLFAKHMDVEPSRIAHVGDNVIEDVGGALSAGMKAIHIDRKRKNKIILKELNLALISELPQIIEVLEEL
jgi:putative hydrolase of the HAD superfamily